MVATVTEEQIEKAFTPPDSHYWIINIPTYARFVYYGTEGEAEEVLNIRMEWEGTRGTKRKADIKNPKDKELVRDEIVGIRIDRANGGEDLPWWPGEGWV